jgi:hypothetical protein
MQAAISEINDELRNGYELIFRPDEKGAGTHHLSIRTRSKLRFFYRTAYFQPAAGMQIASAE